MVERRSAKSYFNFGLIFLFFIRISHEYTNPADVAAINSLYIALGSPPIPGWIAIGGDPCGGNWQGVDCGGGINITSVKLIAANLGGQLGDSLGGFSSINVITLSNNLIGGSIPSNLPASLINLFLSSNKFNGTLPSSLSTLTHLTAMSLNDNVLTGEIPDAFQNLSALTNLDLSDNQFNGKLPPSMKNLSSLTSFDLQNNQLSGTLDTLQDLPLKNLNIENNLFTGIIPPQLQSINNFRDHGNLFNSSNSTSPVTPSSFGTPPPNTPFFPVPISEVPPPRQANETTTADSNNSRSSSNMRRIVVISIVSVFLFLVLVLGILLLLPRCLRERSESHRIPKRSGITPYSGTRETPRDFGSVNLSSNDEHKARTMHSSSTKAENQQVPLASSSKFQWNEDSNKQNNLGLKRNSSEDYLISFDMDKLPPPPPPPLPPPPPPIPPISVQDKVTISSISAAEGPSTKHFSEHKALVRHYTISSLQQYTNSFSHENLVGSGMLGNVYRAELPDGRLLAVKKLDMKVSNQLNDEHFIVLVNNLDKIRHVNVVQLMGYCSEHSQRLLIYKYCANGSLQDALHSDEEHKKKISWNIRMKIALGAARALEYLHEVCEPPIIHRNFKSSNILIGDDFSALLSDCGMAPLILSGSVSQLLEQLLTTYGYGAPELESGIYTNLSDVYSFGVVMLQLLTGRMPYDRSRIREEQNLVRWAAPQLHDIDSVSKMIDPSLEGRYTVKSLQHFVDIISPCVLPKPEFRPLMSEVVQGLENLIQRESSSSSEVE